MSASRSQTVFPYLAYADAPAAIGFLCRAFGFEERSRHPMPDGRVGHAELSLEGGVLMLASVFREMGFASPRELDGVHAQVYWVVEDVDAHFERARAAGATIAAEPVEEHGSRLYRALDPEGHRWMFATPLGEPPGT
jgi:PhnB protein